MVNLILLLNQYIFYMGKKQKDWGFMVDGKWIQHELYLQQTDPKHNQWGTYGQPDNKRMKDLLN